MWCSTLTRLSPWWWLFPGQLVAILTDMGTTVVKFCCNLLAPICRSTDGHAERRRVQHWQGSVVMCCHLSAGHLTAMLRDLVLTRMGRYNDEATVAEARKRFAEHVKGTKALPADLRGPVSVLVFVLPHTVTPQNMSNQIRQTKPRGKLAKVYTRTYSLSLSLSLCLTVSPSVIIFHCECLGY